MTPTHTQAPPAEVTVARGPTKPMSPTQAAHEALAHTRAASMATREAAQRMLELAELGEVPPEMRTIIINGGNNVGQYIVLDQSRHYSKSIGILNLSTVPVFLGTGGMSARPGAGVPFCPAGKTLVLPIIVKDVELGADPAILLALQAEIWLFRYFSVQPLELSS